MAMDALHIDESTLDTWTQDVHDQFRVTGI
jgi:hypothetical protein